METLIIVSYSTITTRAVISADAVQNGFTTKNMADSKSLLITSTDADKLITWADKYDKKIEFSVIYSMASGKSMALINHSKIKHIPVPDDMKDDVVDNLSDTSGQNVSNRKSNGQQLTPFDTYSDTVISYYPNQVSKIYGFGAPVGAVTIGIIGLSGTIDPDDIKSFWLNNCKIPSTSHPTIVIVNTDGTTLDATVIDYEVENSLDVEIAGACCASASTTIVLYHAQNTFQGFYSAFQYAINDTIYKPSIISCSWGIPEPYLIALGLQGTQTMVAFDRLFQTAVNKNISICCATGDNAASDGIGDGIPHVDFPASSPNVVACGGTSLYCPTGTYSNNITSETVWSFDPFSNNGTGGGVSEVFSKPTYQSKTVSTTITKRAIPDISANADPTTGFRIKFKGQYLIAGGTSCAAPLISAYIATTGIKKFMNPVFYKVPISNYNKIMSGSNGVYKASTNGTYSMCVGLGTIKGAVLTPALITNARTV